MAIKTDGGTFLVQPEPQSQTGGVDLDSHFFTPNTLIWGAPITTTFKAADFSNWQTTVDRIKAGDPKAPIAAMIAPSSPITQFFYEFDKEQPNWIASTFYGDQLRIKTTYSGHSISNPVAPALNTAFWSWDSSVSGLSLVGTLKVTTGGINTVFWPDVNDGIVSGKKLEIVISGTGQGSCRLNYRKNNTQKSEQAINGSVFYLDPGSRYTLNIATSSDSYWDYQYPRGRYDFERDGYIYHDGYIKIVINSGARPGPGPIGPTPTPHF